MFETVLEPRVSETDGIGHINNTTIPVWFEAGRHEIFRIFTPDHSFKNWRMIILSMNVDYEQQIYFGYKVTVKTWVKRIGNSSLELYEEIWQRGKRCAKGTSVYVNFNVDKQKSESIPEGIRGQLEEHLWKGKDLVE